MPTSPFARARSKSSRASFMSPVVQHQPTIAAYSASVGASRPSQSARASAKVLEDRSIAASAFCCGNP